MRTDDIKNSVANSAEHHAACNKQYYSDMYDISYATQYMILADI